MLPFFIIGPQFGGTDIILWGENLDAGSSVDILLSDVRCKVLERSDDKLECRTGPSMLLRDGSLKINFDGFSREYDNIRFKYE